MQAWTPERTHALVWTWLGLNIAGQALLAILLTTFFFSRRLRAQRHPIVLNFIVTWFLTTIPACLLLYSGHAEGVQPDPNICLLNAALMSGVPPMEAVAFLAVVIQVFVMLRSVAANKTYVQRTWLTVVLLTSPYVAYIAFSLLVGVIGFSDPNNVTRDAEIVYCTLSHHNAGTFIWVFTAFIVAATFVFGIWIVVMLYKNWRDVRGGGSASEFDMRLVFRALAFTIFELFILATAVLAIFKRDSVPPKFMQAIAPVVVFFIFASQQDVIFSWFFCFGRRHADDTSSVSRASSHSSTNAFAAYGEKPALQDYPTQASNSPEALFNVPSRASSYSVGPRPLMLADAAVPAPQQQERPSSHRSSASLGGGSHLHVQSYSRPARGFHTRSASSSTATSSVYSNFETGSRTSNAPLLRTVEEHRTPVLDHDETQHSYHSHAGVLEARI